MGKTHDNYASHSHKGGTHDLLLDRETEDNDLIYGRYPVIAAMENQRQLNRFDYEPSPRMILLSLLLYKPRKTVQSSTKLNQTPRQITHR